MKLVSISQGKFVKVDDEDYEKVTQRRWVYSPAHGAHRRTRKMSISMHRYIMDAPKGLIVDHKNGDKLDNRRSNLRFCSHAENMRNRRINKNTQSGYKGVRKNHGRWQATIWFNKKCINLGNFGDKTDAARAYNEAAIKYHREFARLNDL